MLQYNGSLVIAGTIKDALKERFCYELGLEPLWHTFALSLQVATSLN